VTDTEPSESPPLDAAAVVAELIPMDEMVRTARSPGTDMLRLNSKVDVDDWDAVVVSRESCGFLRAPGGLY
jgi:Zn-dependent M28 family amino/carboxypeptidase